MSRNVEKTNHVDSDQVWHKPVCQPLEMARGLKFCIKEVEVLYYPSSENKGVDQLTAKLICAYAKRWVSHDASHIKKGRYNYFAGWEDFDSVWYGDIAVAL